VLVRKSERHRSYGKFAREQLRESGDNLDRRVFPKRSGITAGALAALGNLPLAAGRKAVKRRPVRRLRRAQLLPPARISVPIVRSAAR
jgi:hypothetical protein